jgi:choline dehydrogenase-like flavoprotein
MVGFGELHAAIRDGRRCNAAEAFLSPAKDRPNLHVAKLSQVTKIIIDPATKQALGVQFRWKKDDVQEVKVSKEVVISAGAINTPRLLMLSTRTFKINRYITNHSRPKGGAEFPRLCFIQWPSNRFKDIRC